MSALILSIRRFWAKGGRDKVEKAWYSVYVCLYTGLSTYKNNNNNKLYFHSHKTFQLQQNSNSQKQSWTETETPNFSFKTFFAEEKTSLVISPWAIYRMCALQGQILSAFSFLVRWWTLTLTFELGRTGYCFFITPFKFPHVRISTVKAAAL